MISNLQGWAGTLLAFLLASLGVAHKFGEIEKTVKSHDKEIDEVHTLIEGFNGQCNRVEKQLVEVITVSALKVHCKENRENCTTSICKKIEEIKKGQVRLDSKVDSNREIVSEALIKIEHFMGEIHGRNKLIDQERALRSTDK